MKSTQVNQIIVGGLLAVLVGCQSTPNSVSEPVAVNDSIPKQVDSVVVKRLVPADTRWNHLAALMAGLDSISLHEHPGWDQAFLERFSARVTGKVRKMKENRLQKMTEWNVQNMQRNAIDGSHFAFYPFSGGDLIHLAWLYPDADNYLLVAREDVGEIPDLLTSQEKFMKRYLHDIDTVLRDIYKRSYFITKNMQEDTKRKTLINGMLPIIVWTTALLDFDILSVQYFSVNEAGQKQYLPGFDKDDKPNGVEIKVRRRGETKERSIVYVSCDISDGGFDKKPRFYAFIDGIVPNNCNAFIKSASYLLHYDSFEKIRQMILDKSAYLVQDDTGIPYRYFKAGTWKVELHGHYHKPINAFSAKLYQQDLREAYEDSSLYKGELSFSLGYHWSTRKQNQMVAIKRP